MFKRRWEKHYPVALSALTEPQLLQQILITLERMEECLHSIDAKVGLHPDGLHEVAEAIAAGIDHNTEKLSAIKLPTHPDPAPIVFTTT